MNSSQRSPIQDLKQDRSSFQSQTLNKQPEFAYRLHKIDHAFIVQNYRFLRIQQRNQLAKLRMPDQLKRKIFNFNESQNIKYQKPDLVIFNHPFKGKMILTREEVQRQLQKQKMNIQIAEQRQSKNRKNPQNILTQIQEEQKKIQLKKSKIMKEISEKQEQFDKNFLKIPNKQNKKDFKQNKIDKKKETIQQKQHVQKDKNENLEQKIIRFNDIPIIGEQPKIAKQAKYLFSPSINSQNSISLINQQVRDKKFYRSFGNENQIHEFKSNPFRLKQIQKKSKIQSGEEIIRQKDKYTEQPYTLRSDKSISQISAISSNKANSNQSHHQSLNEALLFD